MTSNGGATYVYDAENRLIATGGYSYIYDGDGERVEKCTEGTTPGTCASGATGTLYWRGLGSDPLSETDLSGNVQNTYIFFNGQRIARRDSAGAIHYYFSDHLGTHGVVENATATVCEQDIDYYPYGGVEYDYCGATGVPQNYKFTGKERDAESGLDNFGARYSTSSLGRFMTPDWAAKPVTVPYAKFGDPQTLNLYTYVENSPLNRIDADGHVDWSAGDQHQACGGGSSDCAAETSQQKQSSSAEQTQNQSAQAKAQQNQQPQGSGAPASTTDSSKKSAPATVPAATAAGAVLPPQANGAAQAAKAAAKDFMKSTKPDPPLRGAPGETPDVTRLSPMRQLLKDAVDTLGGALAGAASGATEIVVPLVIAPPTNPQADPKDPRCLCTT